MTNPEFTPEELTREQWRDAVGYEGIYSVSDLGRIRRDKSGHGTQAGRVLKPKYNRRIKYLQVNLWKDGEMKTRRINVMVAKAFLGQCPEGYEVNHKDTVKTNNRLTNLEYITNLANMQHAKANGLMASGERHGMRTHPESIRSGPSCYAPRVLNRESAYQVLTAAGSYEEIGVRFGISKYSVGAIKRRERWKELP